jgi:alpha-galactosidase
MSDSQCNSCCALQVWAGPLSGNRLAVALWNRCSETANITMKLPAVGLDGSAAYSVRDLWKVTQIVSIVTRCQIQFTSLLIWTLKNTDQRKSVLIGICLFFSFQHETLSENVIGTFGAQVDAHDTKMYIFSPAVSVASIWWEPVKAWTRTTARFIPVQYILGQ